MTDLPRLPCANPECGKPFPFTRWGRRHCSAQCQQHHAYLKRKEAARLGRELLRRRKK